MATKAGKIVDEAMDEAAAAVDKTVNAADQAALKADVERLRADIDELIAQLGKTGQHSYDTARKAAVAGMDQIKSQAQDLETQVIDTVREKPITSLAIAAGVGYFLALLSRR